jgi:signal peptidase I
MSIAWRDEPEPFTVYLRHRPTRIRRKHNGDYRWLRRLLRTAGLIVLTYCFILQPAMVPTASMEGTVLVGDHLLMLKFPYAPRVPLTQYRLPRLRSAERGEIVAFRSPVADDDVYLKRVIGIAGDTIEIHGGALYVNGAALPEDYAQVRPGGRLTWQENFGPVLVPEKMLFVMGDNRDNSEDSRYFGPVAEDSVVGEPIVVFWSYDAPTSAWLDPNPLHQVRLYASAIGHAFTQTRWRRTGTTFAR